jgi:hypothetical protein
MFMMFHSLVFFCRFLGAVLSLAFNLQVTTMFQLNIQLQIAQYTFVKKDVMIAFQSILTKFAKY